MDFFTAPNVEPHTDRNLDVLFLHEIFVNKKPSQVQYYHVSDLLINSGVESSFSVACVFPSLYISGLYFRGSNVC